MENGERKKSKKKTTSLFFWSAESTGPISMATKTQKKEKGGKIQNVTVLLGVET